MAAISGILLWAGCGEAPTSGGQVSVDTSVSDGAEEAEAENAEANAEEELEWLTDYEKALSKARETNKPVLINFTGSDWCPPCMALHREVFVTAAFKEYAEENLVLLEIDFPFGKEQSRELKEQNHRLSQEYRVEGFPTVVLLDSDGQEVKRGTYRPGGPRVFINWIEG